MGMLTEGGCLYGLEDFTTKYLHFKLVRVNKKDEEWELTPLRDNMPVGYVAYKKEWKKYVMYTQDDESFFDAKCLREISDFLSTLDDCHKGIKKFDKQSPTMPRQSDEDEKTGDKKERV